MRPVYTIVAFMISLAVLSLVLPFADEFKSVVGEKILPKLHYPILVQMGNISISVFEALPLLSFILLGIWLFTNTFNERPYMGKL